MRKQNARPHSAALKWRSLSCGGEWQRGDWQYRGNRATSRILAEDLRREYFTVVWDSIEALVSITAGVFAGSVSLIGFGLDSVIEVASGVTLVWRLHLDFDLSRREHVERTTLRILSWCFIALAVYIVYECGSTLILHEAPERSIPGIVMATAFARRSAALARANRRVASGIQSVAMHADSETSGLLCIRVDDSFGRIASKCTDRLVVG